MDPSRSVDALIALMRVLRDRDSGCAWDAAQTSRSIAPHTIEEAYEVVDAIERDDAAELCDELGDLLLQVVFHAAIAEDARRFDFGDVVLAITSKLIRRHPHVFGDARSLAPAQVPALWDAIKAEEKAARREARAAAGRPAEFAGALADVPITLPGLTRALKLQAKAGSVGFDWNDAAMVLAKIREETDEVMEAMESGAPQTALAGEIGDLLFSVVNLARHLAVDPEAALRSTNAKFERRFGFVESALARAGSSPEQSTLREMDRLWNEAKAQEGPTTDERQPTETSP